MSVRSVLQSLRSLGGETRLRFLDRLFSRPLFARRAFRPLQRLARRMAPGGGVVLTLTRQGYEAWLASTKELEAERGYADWLSTLRLAPGGAAAFEGDAAAPNLRAGDVLFFPLDDYLRGLQSGGAQEWVQYGYASRQFAHELLDRHLGAPRGGSAEEPSVLIVHARQSVSRAEPNAPPHSQ